MNGMSIAWREEKPLLFNFYLLVGASIGFSLLLTVARSLVTGNGAFYFLWWNLFLAALPVALAHGAVRFRGWKRFLFLVGWILFLPNSFYILTDLFHLKQRSGAPLWYDLLLILSFALNGCMLGIIAIRKVERLVRFRSHSRTFIFVYLFMLVNAFGVYIGRYWRYNSWDVLSDPFRLLKDIALTIVHPVQHLEVWAMSFSYAFFMTLFYLMIKAGKAYVLRAVS